MIDRRLLRNLLPATLLVAVSAHAHAQYCFTPTCADAFDVALPMPTVTPTGTMTVYTTCQRHFEYATFDVVAGNTYRWSTCSADTGVTPASSTRLILRDAGTLGLLCRSTAACGSTSVRMTWKATFTGQVDVALTAPENSCLPDLLPPFPCYSVGVQDLGPNLYPMQNGSRTLCNGTYFDPGGIDFSDPTGAMVTETLFPNFPGEAVTLSFMSFSSSGFPTAPVLEVFDGNSTGAPLLGTFTTTTPPGLLNSSALDGSLTLRVSAGGGGLSSIDWEATILCMPGPAYPSSCNGDGGDQMGCTNCPCSNNAFPGTIGGCLNSVGASSRLLASGNPSLSLPAGDTTDLRFQAEGMPPTAFGVLISGNAVAPGNMANPCFGQNSGVQFSQFDGLRCAVQSTLRHGGRSANGMGIIDDPSGPSRVWGGEAQPMAGIGNQAGFVAGQTRYFQINHRDEPSLVCMRGLNNSQAVRVTFTP